MYRTQEGDKTRSFYRIVCNTRLYDAPLHCPSRSADGVDTGNNDSDNDDDGDVARSCVHYN